MATDIRAGRVHDDPPPGTGPAASPHAARAAGAAMAGRPGGPLPLAAPTLILAGYSGRH